jgi:tetratricopeptide (TPR) repeat protein
VKAALLTVCASLLLSTTPAWSQDSSASPTPGLTENAPEVSRAGPTTKSPSTDATQAFWSGKQLYDAGEFTSAIEQFQHAYAATHDPTLVYNIAQCHRKLGQCSLALENYQAFLRLSPESPLAPQAEKQAGALRELCPEANVASAPPPQTEPNHQPPSLRLRKPVQSGRPPSEPASANASRATAPEPMRVWAVAALSGAVLAGGIAAGLEIWNEGRYQDWRTRDQSLSRGAQGETNLQWVARVQANDNLGRSIQRVDHEAIYLSVGAGALLTTAAALYWWPHGKSGARRDGVSERPRGPAVSAQVAPHAGGLWIIGSF